MSVDYQHTAAHAMPAHPVHLDSVHHVLERKGMFDCM